jgi:predicted amidohydrolase
VRYSLACAQFAPRKAELSCNLDRIAEIARQAAGEGADLVLFPETATSGYFLEGGVLESALHVDDLLHELDERLSGFASDIAVGFYERHEGNLYNSCAYLSWHEGARVVFVYRKFFLATYGVFDEERFVSRGRELGVFDTRFGRMAILICEDVWHSIMPTLCALAGATLLLVPSASPARGFDGARPANLDRYERLLRCLTEEHGVYCGNAMLCGFEGGKGFPGGSMIVDPFGEVIARGPLLDEHLLVAEIDPERITVARAQTPLFSDLQAAWADLARLAN